VMLCGMGCFKFALAEETLTGAITTGKTTADIRYRYEMVDQDGISKNAGASTIRTRLGYQTGSFKDISATLAFEDITVAGQERYNSSVNGKTAYPVVLDPAGTEVDQAYLSYQGVADTVVKYGRQQIILDNARFVGNVGWRQNEQTFDALSLVNKGLPNTVLTYAYLNNVNTVTGTNTPMGSHLLNIHYAGFPLAKLTAYGYFLDFDTATDSKTLGIRVDGEIELASKFTLIYTAELATQSDYADAPSTVDADYQMLEVGGKFSRYTVKVGYELLGGDGTYAFQTPLATKHAFNGWADKFASSTPASGVEDISAAFSAKVNNTALSAVYHDYSADSGGDTLGSELDLLAATKFAGGYSAGVKYASYQADTYLTDTDKFWVWGAFKF